LEGVVVDNLVLECADDGYGGVERVAEKKVALEYG
jgi:hypothetical protein